MPCFAKLRRRRKRSNGWVRHTSGLGRPAQGKPQFSDSMAANAANPTGLGLAPRLLCTSACVRLASSSYLSCCLAA